MSARRCPLPRAPLTIALNSQGPDIVHICISSDFLSVMASFKYAHRVRVPCAFVVSSFFLLAKDLPQKHMWEI